MKRFKELEEVMKKWGLSHQEVIDYLITHSESQEILGGTIAVSDIKPGYFWYEDDTFSKSKISDKKVKAIVELTDNGTIYGDLTASEIIDVTEKQLTWEIANYYMKDFSKICGENEKIVWYDIDKLKKVYQTYDEVRSAFRILGKRSRRFCQWSISGYQVDTIKYFNDNNMENSLGLFDRAWYLDFNNGECTAGYLNVARGIRPVIAKKVE